MRAFLLALVALAAACSAPLDPNRGACSPAADLPPCTASDTTTWTAAAVGGGVMRHTLPLSAQCWLVLHRLADAGRPGTLMARRIYPHPRRAWLSKKRDGNYAAPMAEATIETLLGHGLIEARQKDPFADRVEYVITEQGRDVAQAGELAYEDENLDLLGGASV